MIIYTLRLILRNIRKSKLYSFINIFGLALGLAAVVLLSCIFSLNAAMINIIRTAIEFSA